VKELYPVSIRAPGQGATARAHVGQINRTAAEETKFRTGTFACIDAASGDASLTRPNLDRRTTDWNLSYPFDKLLCDRCLLSREPRIKRTAMEEFSTKIRHYGAAN
jgi:hypothetical protein